MRGDIVPKIFPYFCASKFFLDLSTVNCLLVNDCFLFYHISCNIKSKQTAFWHQSMLRVISINNHNLKIVGGRDEIHRTHIEIIN